MSRISPSKYQRLDVANATLDAAEDRIGEMELRVRELESAYHHDVLVLTSQRDEAVTAKILADEMYEQQYQRALVAERERDEASSILGAVIVASTLRPGETYEGLYQEHAAVAAMIEALRERDEARAELALVRESAARYMAKDDRDMIMRAKAETKLARVAELEECLRECADDGDNGLFQIGSDFSGSKDDSEEEGMMYEKGQALIRKARALLEKKR